MQQVNGRNDGRRADRPGYVDRSGYVAARSPGGRRHVQRPDDLDATQIIAPIVGHPADMRAAVTPGDLVTGRVLDGRYRLEGLLGTGAMSEVHRATDLQLNRPATVKLFGPGADRQGLRQFQEEARMLAKLSQPGVVAVYDCGVEADQPYLVTESVNGWTLAEFTRQEQLPLDEVVRIGAALCDILGQLHQQHVVHRNLKPSNVLVGSDGRVRLTDFGNVRPHSPDHDLGSLAHLSPEQVRGDWVGPPADVYALGLVLLEAVTGPVEYPGGGPDVAAERLTRRPAVPADLPEGLRQALLAMTDPDPRSRPTAAHSASLLRQADLPRHDLPPRVDPIPLAIPDPEPASRTTMSHILVIALGMLALAALIGFTAFVSSDDSSSSTKPTVSAPSGASSVGTSSTATSDSGTLNTGSSDTGSPSSTRRTTPTARATAPSGGRTTTPSVSPSGGLPDLPDSSEISTAVLDDVAKAWNRFTKWLAGLF
ncbi:MAG: protein kinase [Pseudonocardia sp.]|nr:protein kinase [Pseudonocardia sp.]